MNYFIDIRGFAQLKKEYRRLAIENHPDKGGDTRIMQEINLQFEKLYDRFQKSGAAEHDQTGYANDYEGATSEQYTQHVYNEYRWCGSRYKGQRPKEILDLLRTWLKETYPRCRFSVLRTHYNSFYIYLVTADFPAFRDGSEYHHKQVNQYHIEKDAELTERAKEILTNVREYVMSYNYDDSDSMTDYFDTNFYLNMGVGKSDKPFQTVVPQLKARKGEQPKEFRHPEGEHHKAIRRALDKCRFAEFLSGKYGKIIVLGSDYIDEKGERIFFPKSYSSSAQAQKRIDKLVAAGIDCRLSGYRKGYIQFVSYNPFTKQGLERERQEYTEAYQKWTIKNRPAYAVQSTLL